MSAAVRAFRYSVPNVRYAGWAILFLDDAGCFAALSDWGNFSYRWPAVAFAEGEDIRRFLLTCDDEYLVRKLGQGQREFRVDETQRAIRKHVLERRRAKRLTKEQALYEWDVAEFDNGEASIGDWLSATCIPDAIEFLVFDRPRGVYAFVEKSWPRLRECIREELGAAAGHAEAREP